MRRSSFQHLPLTFWLIPMVALAFALRLFRLGAQSLWFDEIVTVYMAQLSWYDGLLALLGQGIQLTPLFHWAVKLWLPLGDAEWLLRFPAAVVGTLTVPLIFQLGRVYFNRRVGLLAALLFAINPYQIWYGQELRLYALLPLAAAGSMWAFGRLLRREQRRDWWALAGFNMVGFLAHYFMFLVATVQFLVLLVTFKQTYSLLRKWVVAQMAAALPLLPWWGFIIYQRHFAIGVGWVPFPAWADPALTLMNFAFAWPELAGFPALAGALVLLASLIAGCYRAWLNRSAFYLLGLWLFFPFAVVLLLMKFSPVSLYVDRYFLVTSPPLLLLVAAGLLSFQRNWLRWGLTAAFVALTCFGLWRVYFDAADFRKDDWRALARQLDERAGPADAAITCTDGYHLALDYYLPHHNLPAGRVLFAAQLGQVPASAQTVWLVRLNSSRASGHYLAKPNPPALDESELPPVAAKWHRANLQQVISQANLSAYGYRLASPDVLPQIVAWQCGQ